MVAMSIFDLMGSAAYSLTTLPIPTEYYVQGAQGTQATCTAQGFFIQVGTTSAFINVSLAAYYYCIIKLGWSESKVMGFRKWFLGCPITVGLAFAFAGIPFYGMLFLWCNNSAPWWPDIPVAIAILVTTCTMVSVCLSVYKTEKATQQYTGSTTFSTSSIVFWQSVWYLLSFYLTWPPYLALQYLWAAGNYNVSYGFVVFAVTLVPLQGFWNSVVFFRTRVKRKVRQLTSRVSSTVGKIPTRLRSQASNVDQSRASAALHTSRQGSRGSDYGRRGSDGSDYGRRGSDADDSFFGQDPSTPGVNGLTKSSEASEDSYEKFVRYSTTDAADVMSMRQTSKVSFASIGDLDSAIELETPGANDDNGSLDADVDLDTEEKKMDKGDEEYSSFLDILKE
jgi:hypothetical protein